MNDLSLLVFLSWEEDDGVLVLRGDKDYLFDMLDNKDWLLRGVTAEDGVIKGFSCVSAVNGRN